MHLSRSMVDCPRLELLAHRVGESSTFLGIPNSAYEVGIPDSQLSVCITDL